MTNASMDETGILRALIAHHAQRRRLHRNGRFLPGDARRARTWRPFSPLDRHSVGIQLLREETRIAVASRAAGVFAVHFVAAAVLKLPPVAALLQPPFAPCVALASGARFRPVRQPTLAARPAALAIAHLSLAERSASKNKDSYDHINVLISSYR